MKSIKYNYYNLMHLNPRNYLLTLLIVVLETLIFSHVLFKEVYSRKNYYAVFKDGYLYLNIDIDNTDAVNHGKYLNISGKKYEYKINNIGDLQVDEIKVVNYQTYELVINDSFKQNELQEITIYYNKERIINKLLKVFFGKE